MNTKGEKKDMGNARYEVIDTVTGDTLEGPYVSLRRAARAVTHWESSYCGRIAVFDAVTENVIDSETLLNAELS